MRFPIFIGKRLSLKEDRAKASSPGVIIAVSGIALAFIIMIVAISVVTGFKKEISEKVMGFESQILIVPTLSAQSDTNINEGLTLNDSIYKILYTQAPDAKISLALRLPGILKTDNSFQGIVFKSINGSIDNDFIGNNLISGEIPDYTDESKRNQILISHATADALNLSLNDKIYAHFFLNGAIKSRSLIISGIYDTHFNEYDGRMAYSHISLLQRLCNVDSLTGNMIELTGMNNNNIETITDDIRSALWQYTAKNCPEYIYDVQNVFQTGALYFNWLELLDTNVVVILILMTFVSGFTLISSLFIIILERIRTIGLLKSLGATNASIRQIFIFIAQRLVFRGLLIGNIIGISFLMLQNKFHILPLDPNAYYINYVPTDINWMVIGLLNIGVIVVAGLILIFPTHIIATLSPANSMRYE